MTTAPLPEEVLAFLRENVHSVEQLEVLLLVRTTPDRAWTAADVSKEMRSALMSASARLDDLARHGLLERCEGFPASFRYRVGHPDEAAVARLAHTYAQRRHAVIEAIFARS